MNDSLVMNLGENFARIADIRTDLKSMEMLSLAYQDNIMSFISDDSEKSIQEKAKVIQQLTSSLKSKKKNTKIVIPDSATFSEIVEMPKLREKELLSAIKYQADQFIPMPIEETVIDLEILNEDKVNKKLLVLIVAAPQKLIAQVTDIAALAGLYPEAIENELSAVGRLMSFCSGINTVNSMVLLNLGYSTSSLYFYNAQLKLITDVHTFKLGQQLFLKEIEINTGLDQTKGYEAIGKIGLAKDSSVDLETILKPITEELIKETEHFIVTVKEKYHLPKLEQIALFNLASSINLLNRKMEAQLGIPVSLFNMDSVIKKNQISQGLNNQLSSFVSLTGAALE